MPSSDQSQLLSFQCRDSFMSLTTAVLTSGRSDSIIKSTMVKAQINHLPSNKMKKNRRHLQE